MLAVLAGLKMSAAAFVATRLYRSSLLGDRTLVQGAALWLAAVLALYGLLVWLAATPFIARLPARAAGDPGDPAGAARRGAAGARLQSASLMEGDR